MENYINLESKHFSLRQVADGIYAAIHTEGGSAICNAGLVDLDGLLLVFDTFLTPQAAEDLYQFALVQFHQAPQIVINSHYHNDHIWGNQVFIREANIISSAKTYQQFDTLGLEEFEWYSANAPKKLDEIQKQYQQSTDVEAQAALVGMLGYYEGLVEALPSLKVCKPNLTFEKQLHFYGDQRFAQLITFEGAHTGSDSVLYLPQDGVLFTGDLLFVNAHPYLSEGDPSLLLDVLNRLLTFDASIFVPGHGPIGTAEDIHLMIGYVEDCLRIGKELALTGVDDEVLSKIEIPKKYAGWIMPHMFQGNLISISKRIKSVT
jgi:glyoxylase-like metal-dependent hydrolase (beta-lactamase superfamily II)